MAYPPAAGKVSQGPELPAETVAAQTASARTASAQTASAQTTAAQTAAAQTAAAQTVAAERFGDFAGRPPEGLWAAPGRVNLIGEHTDYNAGLALPFAIDRVTVVAAASRPDRLVRICSTTVGEDASASLEDVASWGPTGFSVWSRYALGVVWATAIELPSADLPGLDLVIASDVPLRSGLSSSAALTVSIAVALNELCDLGLPNPEVARLAQKAEAGFAGAPCGLMDQFAALEGKPGAGVLIDFLSFETEQVPLDVGPITVINTRVEHANADGAYADRRRACETAADRLGLSSLRQATLAQVETGLAGELQKRARHVVTENERVRETVARLRRNAPIGDLLLASHVSLRDDYEVSCPELDNAVSTAMAHGATGARLTGAGLGGCAIALGVEADDLKGPVASAFAGAGFGPPELFPVVPSQGARRVA